MKTLFRGIGTGLQIIFTLTMALVCFGLAIFFLILCFSLLMGR